LKEIVVTLTLQVTLAQSRNEAYFLGLVAGILYNVKRESEALLLAKKVFSCQHFCNLIDIVLQLVDHQQADGSVSNAETSITSSMGEALLIETTRFNSYNPESLDFVCLNCRSILVLSWLNNAEFTGNLERAVRWLATRCQDGENDARYLFCSCCRSFLVNSSACACSESHHRV